MAEEEGFEPPRAVKLLSVFKTDPLSRTWVFLQLNIHYYIVNLFKSQSIIKIPRVTIKFKLSFFKTYLFLFSYN